jgi:uncharacterized protein (TIGR03083 family)
MEIFKGGNMLSVETVRTAASAGAVPYVAAREAHSLLEVELKRFLEVVETLDDADWNRPTACSTWRVRDILAHQAGSYASATSYGGLVRDATAKPQEGQLMEDVINNLQVSERANKTPSEMIAELKAAAPRAMQNWAYHFRLPKLFSVPHAVIGKLSLRHLMWVIHSRDTWMHRLDICRAVNRDFVQTAEHDGRIAALVMRDVDTQLARTWNGGALLFDLSGTAGGVWTVGAGELMAAVQMDVLDFNILASGRFSYEEGRARATITGDVRQAEEALKGLLVLY